MQTTLPLVDEILGTHAADLGRDFIGYRNHIHRVLNHFRALSGSDELPDAVSLAVPFHDLGIWTGRTLDYLESSACLAQTYLEAHGLEQHSTEVHALINEHHKLRAYHGPHAATVETYRQADWVDVSMGVVRFGLSRAHLRVVQAAFPDAGFHWRLAALTARQFLRTPLRPLPMMHW